MINEMMGNEAAFQRLQKWYKSQCNGDWEHSFGIKIETLDNPGWIVTIDLSDTEWESITLDRKISERSDQDWVQYEIANNQFIGCGGSNNLIEIINLFFQVIDS
ncbi:MAG: immunity 53 family protein [Nitrosomonas sp.]